MDAQTLLDRCGPWIPVVDAYEELAELYADEGSHKHNAHVVQHTALFSVDIAYPHNPKTKQTATIDILQNQSIQTTGQTGFCLWDGAICLAHFLAKSTLALELAGSSIVELGSGSGLVSLSLLHHHLPPASITMTDQEALLKHLRRNFDNHGESSAKPQRRTTSNALPTPEIRIEELEWAVSAIPLAKRHPALFASSSSATQSRTWDVIVSSDCVYNEHLVKPYVATIRELLGPRVTSEEVEESLGRQPLALVCFELRSSDVTLLFLEELLEGGDLEVRRLGQEGMPDGFQGGSLALYAVFMR